MAQNPQTAPISLDQLIVLNDEIAALVRAGIPLDKGLCALGDDLPGSLGRVASGLAKSLEQGHSLEAALAQRGRQFPPVYRAVVEAGMRAGRLPAAFESLADSIARIRDARRAVATALAYPLMVAAVAWGFFVFYIIFIAPRMIAIFEFRGPVANKFADLAAALGQTVQYWGPGVPLLVFLVSVFWWWYSARGSLAQPWWNALLLGWCPWIGRMLRATRNSTFVDILTLLVRNDVPLDEALLLAAESSGDARTIRAVRPLAEAITRGEFSTQDGSGSDLKTAGLPPLLSWIMSSGGPRGTLLSALEHAAEIYHRRARRYAETARLMVPIVLSLAIGGSMTLAYALVMFVPYVTLLKTIALP
jgi:general secretion pathway protein F